MKPDKGKRGPEPDRLKESGDWQDAVKKALQKERPAGGWPKPDKGKSPGKPKKG